MKSREEIMNMLEAFDLTGSLRDAGELAGCSHHTVAAYVTKRDEGRLGGVGPMRRGRIIESVAGEDRGVGGALLWQDPRRSLPRQAEGAGRSTQHRRGAFWMQLISTSMRQLIYATSK